MYVCMYFERNYIVIHCINTIFKPLNRKLLLHQKRENPWHIACVCLVGAVKNTNFVKFGKQYEKVREQGLNEHRRRLYKYVD